MKNLEIHSASEVPAAQIVTLEDPGITVIDYAAVTTAQDLALRAFKTSEDPAVVDLANAIFSINDVLTELVRGLDHGKIAVFNYPSEGAHLEQ